MSKLEEHFSPDLGIKAVHFYLYFSFLGRPTWENATVLYSLLSQYYLGNCVPAGKEVRGGGARAIAPTQILGYRKFVR